MFKLKISIVIPIHNEGDFIKTLVARIAQYVKEDYEILFVYDSPEEVSLPIILEIRRTDSRIRAILNSIGRGPATAIRTGIENSQGEVVVICMADGSDDVKSIPDLFGLVERGIVVACASRYMPGGRQIGAPWLKSKLSRLAGLMLYWLARIGTKDSTNSFKAYKREFLLQTQIESTEGFEIGLELVAKAKRQKLPIAEIPTIWIERSFGSSNFKLFRWFPKYLYWFFYAFGIGARR